MKPFGNVRDFFQQARDRAVTSTDPRPIRPWERPGSGATSAPVKPWVGQIVDQVDSGSIPRPNPIRPIGSVVRRWHLTPWKTTEKTALLDDLNGSNLGEDDPGIGAWDVLNTLVGQAGNIYSASQGMVPYQPRPGQYLPVGTTASSRGLGMSTNTLLMLGAGLLGVMLLTRKK